LRWIAAGFANFSFRKLVQKALDLAAPIGEALRDGETYVVRQRSVVAARSKASASSGLARDLARSLEPFFDDRFFFLSLSPAMLPLVGSSPCAGLLGLGSNWQKRQN